MFRTMFSQAKKHPALFPLFLFIGCGGVGAFFYIVRLAVRSPDVCWDKKNNPEPWNKLGPKDQYKVWCKKLNVEPHLPFYRPLSHFGEFYAVNVDYDKLKKEGPDY